MSTTSTYTAGGATARVYYNVTADSDPTRRTVTAQVQFNMNGTLPDSYTGYVYVDGSQVGTIDSGGVWVHESGSSYGSMDGGWSRSYTKTHSSATHTLSFKVRYKVGGSTYTSGTLSGANFTVSAKPSYAVAYNANSGSNAPSPQTKWYGESLTLSSSKPYRNNYEFYHWNTSSSNSGTSYSPGATYNDNQALNLYAIWNPTITFNANGTGVSSLPANVTKTYGVTYTIPSTTPIRRGYQFRYWTTNSDGTGTTYQAGASYTSNVAVTLYAQWIKVADPPTISYIKVIRCDANGVADDTGTYCFVQAKWSVDTTSAGMATNEGVLTGSITPSIDGSTEYTFYEGDSGTSGVAKAIIENCDTDTTYMVSVTVTNSVVGTGQSAVLATTASDVLTSANFTMDFRRGGDAIGIGSAAPASGLEVGWDSQFDKNVNIDGNVTAANLKYSVMTDKNTIFSYIVSNWTCTSVKLHRYGRMVQFEAVFTCSSPISTSAITNHIAYIASTYAPVGDLYYTTNYGGGFVNRAGGIFFIATQAVPANTGISVNIVYMSKT